MLIRLMFSVGVTNVVGQLFSNRNKCMRCLFVLDLFQNEYEVNKQQSCLLDINVRYH